MRSPYLSLFLVCCAAWVCCAAGCATVRTLDVSSLPTFTLEEINAAPEQTVAAAITTGPKAFVVKLKKGDRLPINLRAALGPIAVESGQNYLTFAQDLWLYVSGTGSPDFMLLSPDGQRWAPAHEPASLSKLFGLQTGTFQLGFGVTKEQGAAFTVAVEKK